MMRADHDTAYKQLFAHPEMMRDLLRAFVPQPWAKALDVAAFERINASYVGGAGAQRHDDMVWRLRVGGNCVYVYVLLEFQSSGDRWMALRMQVYVGMLYQDLVKRRKLGRNGKLPPVLPIVLYAGERPWRASKSVSGLVLAPPAGLEWLQPEQQYLLIDHGRGPASSADRNMVTALFSLQHCRSRQACSDVVAALAAWLKEESNQLLRDSLSSWISRWMRHKLKRKRHRQLAPKEDMMKHAVEDKEYDSWEECLFDELVHGRAEGRAEGREEGARDLLLRLLGRNAAVIPPEWAQRIDEAGQEELEAWLERLYDGTSAQELFDAPAA